MATQNPRTDPYEGFVLSWWNLNRVDLIGLGAFRSLGGLKLHTLALIERPESGRLDCTVMDENVRTAAVHGDEAVALFGIEPLNGSLRHETSPSICIRNRTSRPRHAVGRRVFLTPTQSAGRSTNHDNRPLATASLACHRSPRNVNPAKCRVSTLSCRSRRVPGQALQPPFSPILKRARAMSTRSPLSGVLSALSSLRPRCSSVRAGRPSARTTRHHGTPSPSNAMTWPTCRGPPRPTISAMSPYVATWPGGI